MRHWRQSAPSFLNFLPQDRNRPKRSLKTKSQINHMSCRWNAIRKERTTWHHPTENESIWVSTKRATKSSSGPAATASGSFTTLSSGCTSNTERSTAFLPRYVHGRKKAAQEAGVKFEKLINKASDSPASADANISAFGASGKDKTVSAIS